MSQGDQKEPFGETARAVGLLAKLAVLGTAGLGFLLMALCVALMGLAIVGLVLWLVWAVLGWWAALGLALMVFCVLYSVSTDGKSRPYGP
ncbi:hypothetical protein GCM10019016_117860 [Streptomyces prasinosporus]|uniref:Phage holin family protein n=1 Tax=Streptomyces prasinosporus TaxID=68256 RepID=A0ABP6UDB4_9ACTN